MAQVLLKAQELFASGKWNGIDFNDQDIDMIVAAFSALGLAGKVPLKLTHDGPDARTDLETRYALGWVRKIWREGGKLLGDLEVPDKVVTAIKDGYLKFVSVELLKNVRADTRVIPWVLDAVALLGSEQPAVGILKDLQALMARTSGALHFEARHVFTKGDSQQMTTEVEKLKEREQRAILLLFNAKIHAGACLPRDRVAFEKRFGTTGTIEDAEEWLANTPKSPHRFNRATSLHTPDSLSGSPRMQTASPDGDLLAAVHEFIEKREIEGRPVTFDQAVLMTLKREPALGERWVAFSRQRED